jgi:hypothetical protein
MTHGSTNSAELILLITVLVAAGIVLFWRTVIKLVIGAIILLVTLGLLDLLQSIR